MMGTKARHLAPLVQVSLEELVPADHFYRHLERTLDLSVVREVEALSASFWGLLRNVLVLVLKEQSFLVSFGSASSIVRPSYASL